MAVEKLLMRGAWGEKVVPRAPPPPPPPKPPPTAEGDEAWQKLVDDLDKP